MSIVLKKENSLDSYYDLPEANKVKPAVVFRVKNIPDNHFKYVGRECVYFYSSNGDKWVPVGYTAKKETSNE